MLPNNRSPHTETPGDTGEESSSYPKNFLKDDTVFILIFSFLGTNRPCEAEGRAEHRTIPSV